jgi:chromate transporter
VNDRTPQGEDDAKLRDLALVFTKLGCVALGGPAAHIAMMRAEIVGRRRWMGEQEFLDLMGASNLLAVRFVRTRRGEHEALILPLGLPLGLLAAPATLAGTLGIFFSFLKIGWVLFGSGYVLLAFLRSEFVDPGLLTYQQLLDAVAVGQVTPGPVFTTATFIGYVLGGFPGAVLASVGIFLPGFVFVALSGPIIPRLRNCSVLAGLLDGANVAWLALMAGVTWQLGRASLVEPVPALIALAALVMLFATEVNPAWLVLGGGSLGLAYHYLLG